MYVFCSLQMLYRLGVVISRACDLLNSVCQPALAPSEGIGRYRYNRVPFLNGGAMR